MTAGLADASRVLTTQLVFPADYSIAKKAEILRRPQPLSSDSRRLAAGFSRRHLDRRELIVGTFVPQAGRRRSRSGDGRACDR
jgi:hypothetical protein